MTELSAGTLALMQTAASAGLVICLIMAGAFATVGFVAGGEQDRRHAALDAERIARIGELLREGETARVASRVATPPEELALPAEVITVVAEAPPDTEDAPETQDAPDASPPSLADLRADEADAPVMPDALAGDVRPLPQVPPEALALLSPPPRRLATEEAAAIADALDGQQGAFSVEVVSAPEAESRLYALQLTGALRGAGLDARGPVAVLTTAQADGVVVGAEVGADGPGAILLGALQSSGLAAMPTRPGTALDDILTPDQTDVRIYVGAMRAAASPPEPVPAPERRRILEPA